MPTCCVRVLIAVLIAATPAAAQAEPCTLKTALKVSVGGKWEPLKVGDAIAIISHTPRWSTVTSARGTGKASSAMLEAACALAEAVEPAVPAVPPRADKINPIEGVPQTLQASALPISAAPAPQIFSSVAARADVVTGVVTAGAVAPVVAVAAAPVAAPVALEALATDTIGFVQAGGEGFKQADARVRLVAVLDLKPSGPEAAAAAGALTTMLAAEAAALNGYRSISRNEIKSILAHQADAQLLGCAEVRCAADVAQLINADVLITGQVDKVGGATVVSLSLIDAGDKDSDTGPAVLSRQEAAWRGSDDGLLLLARPLVQRIFDGANAGNHVGTVEVFVEDDALVIVDGKEVGAAPLQPLRNLPTGVHTLTVTKGGRVSQTFDVVLARNETTIARVELVEESLFDQPWFWAAAGGVVLVAGGTAAGITTYAFLNQENPTRVVLGKASVD